MSRKASMLLSIGISIALIAGAIWFLNSRLGYGMGYWGMPHHRMMGGGYMGIFMILFWVVVMAAIALVISGALSEKSTSRRQEPPAPPNALDVLKRRYAAGEIDKARYEAMKKEIES